MDPTVEAAMIAAVAALVSTLVNWGISLRNTVTKTRSSYSKFIIQYKKKSIELIQESLKLNKAISDMQSTNTHRKQQEEFTNTLRDIHTNTGNRNTALRKLSELKTKGVILYPSKKIIINHVFKVATQGYHIEIQRDRGWPQKADEPWITNLINRFPSYPQNIYTQLEQAVNNYSIILCIFKNILH